MNERKGSEKYTFLMKYVQIRHVRPRQCETVHRTQKNCEGKGKKVEEKTPRDLGPADSTVHTREDGRTVQLRGDSACKWINGQCSLEHEYRGRIGQIQKTSHWKREVANPISKFDDFVTHVFREHNQEAGHWADVVGRRTEKKCH